MDNIILPPKRPSEPNESWTGVQSVVIAGANGSGKSRLGAWIEQNNAARPVHRIAAQRALHLPDLVNPMTYERATSQLYYGSYQPNWNELQRRQQKIQSRWGGQPVIQMLSDYELVVSTLFADEAKRNREYTEAAQRDLPTAKPKDCSLDILQRIWRAIFPHRELVVKNEHVSARIPTSGQEYAGRMMSDGERVAFYLLGQVLCAPSSAIVVIDEPEIHLHRAIQTPLWDEAEVSRPDCTFVYVTHDLEFAASRSGARKIWTKSFDGSSWEWEELEASYGLPEELTLQVLGNRRPVLFVEGSTDSLDSTLYRALYPDKLILPVASCCKVIEAKRTMTRLGPLHHLAVEGLVDRDHRSDEEIKSLRNQGLHVADVAEVENLFCTSAALCAAAAQVKSLDVCEAVESAKARVISELKKAADAQIAARAIAEIQFRLGGFGPSAGKANVDAIQRDLTAYIDGIDVDTIFKRCKERFDQIITTNDYDDALRYYNCKGITSFVASAFGLTARAYCILIAGMVRSEPRGALAEDLRSRIS